MAFSYAVALTGSIATGKSTAAHFLEQLGFALIDADTVAHQILNQQYKAIAKMFGEGLVEFQTVNRKALGKIVFSDTQKRKALEDLLHPLILQEITRQSEVLDAKKMPYLVDIPLFFEYRHYPIDKVAVVYAPLILQRQRLMQRNNMSDDEAQKRIEMQGSIEDKRKKADYVIDNSGTLAALKHECKRVKALIEKDFV